MCQRHLDLCEGKPRPNAGPRSSPKGNKSHRMSPHFLRRIEPFRVKVFRIRPEVRVVMNFPDRNLHRRTGSESNTTEIHVTVDMPSHKRGDRWIQAETFGYDLIQVFDILDLIVGRNFVDLNERKFLLSLFEKNFFQKSSEIYP